VRSASPRPAAPSWTPSRHTPTSARGPADWRHSASGASRRFLPCSGRLRARWPRPGCYPTSTRPEFPTPANARPLTLPGQPFASCVAGDTDDGFGAVVPAPRHVVALQVHAADPPVDAVEGYLVGRAGQYPRPG